MQLPLGDGTIDVTLPDCEVTVARAPGGTPVDVRSAAEAAMERPHGDPLHDRVDSDAEIAVVVTDITRDAPGDVLLSVLLDELGEAGVGRAADETQRAVRQAIADRRVDGDDVIDQSRE